MKPTFAQYAHFYLNTGLKVQIFGVDQMWFEHEFDEEDLKDGTEWTLSGLNDPKLSFENGEAVPFLLTRNETSWIGIEARNFMPMMRPLSSLTSEITVDGSQKVVPIVELAKMARFESDENNKAEFRGVGKPPYGYDPTKYKPYYDCWYQFRRRQEWNIIYDNRGLYVKESHHGWYESMAVNMPDLYQQLLKWHVNIFDISPDEFIEINESKTITGRKALKK